MPHEEAGRPYGNAFWRVKLVRFSTDNPCKIKPCRFIEQTG